MLRQVFKLVIIFVISCYFSSTQATEASMKLHLLEVNKIWDNTPHCAFTDLVRYKNCFYVCFREATTHLSSDGTIRIIKSGDGGTWESAKLFTKSEFDLRDPKFSITPDGKLMAHWFAVSNSTPASAEQGTYVTMSSDGEHWSDPRRVCADWLWRVSWHPNNGCAYNAGTYFWRTNNGFDYSILATLPQPPGYPDKVISETTTRFDPNNGTCYMLARRSGTASEIENTAYLISCPPPYTENWTSTDIGFYLGGPNFIRLPNGKWLACGRRINETRTWTQLLELNVIKREAIPLMDLPSGGDCSYAGMVVYDGKLWISYYSSHEDSNTSIYLAQVTYEDCNVSCQGSWTVRDNWHFDNATGVTTDSGPGGLNLTAVGSPAQIDPGFSGQGFACTPTATTQDGYAAVASDFNENVAGVRISAMIKPHSSYSGAGGNSIFNRGSHFNLCIYDVNTLLWEVYGPAGTIYIKYNGTVNLFDGAWHNVVASYSPFTHEITLQVDGGKIQSASYSGTTLGTIANSYLFIGTGTSGQSGLGFDGDIDEVQLSTYEFTSSGTHVLTVQSSPDGLSVVPVEGVYSYTGCNEVELRAEKRVVNCPDVYKFSHWEGEVGTANSSETVVILDSDKTVTAVYDKVTACGDECHLFSDADFNNDCRVDFRDFSVLMAQF